MGIVDPEDRDSLTNPEKHHVTQLTPQRLPVLALEVERIDVLILLRRVLRVLDRAVGKTAEPLGMLVHPWMIGGRLERDVESDLEIVLGRLRDELAKLLEGSELGMNGRVTSQLRSDRPRTPGLTLVSLQGVVPSLAEALSDRMNRRQVQHVESHRGDVRKPLGRGCERAVLPTGPGRSGEHLVPGREPCTLPIDGDRQGPIELQREPAIRVAIHQRGKIAREQLAGLRLARYCPASKHLSPPAERLSIGGRWIRPLDGLVDQLRCNQKLDRHVLLRVDPFAHVPEPGEKPVDPGHDRELVVTDLGDLESPPPTVIDERKHRRLVPLGLIRPAPQEPGRNAVVSVREDIRLDLHAIAHHALGRKTTAVDLRCHALDDDSLPTVETVDHADTNLHH